MMVNKASKYLSTDSIWENETSIGILLPNNHIDLVIHVSHVYLVHTQSRFYLNIVDHSMTLLVCRRHSLPHNFQFLCYLVHREPIVSWQQIYHLSIAIRQIPVVKMKRSLVTSFMVFLLEKCLIMLFNFVKQELEIGFSHFGWRQF